MLSKRGVRLFKIAGFLLGIGLVGLVAAKLIEDARGKKAWDIYLSEQQARGAKVLWEEFIPPEIPDEENFAAHPSLDLKALNSLDPATWPNQRADSPPQPGWKLAQPYSLLKEFKPGTATSEIDAAQQIIAHVAQHEDLFEALRSATDRTNCRFDLNYANPHLIDFPLQEVQYATLTLNALALSHLRLDQPSEALADALAAIRLIRHLDTAPSLIVAVVQVGQMDRTLQTVWEGLRDHAWTPTQLQSIGENLKAWNPSNRFVTSLKQDRAAMFTIMAHQSQVGQQMLFRGWAYQNMVSFGKLLDDHVFLPAEEAHVLDYERTLALETEVEARRKRILGRYPHPYDLFTVVALPSLPKITSRVLQLDTNLALALQAIELELHYQTHQSHPENFETPDPIRYRLKQDGTPLLFHLGINKKDDNGIPDKDRTQGDWAWQYTAS